MRVKAIDGILSGNKQPAIEYLKFVVLHRSRAVADAEHASLIKGAAFEKQRRLDEAAKLAARNRPKPKWQKPSF